MAGKRASSSPRRVGRHRTDYQAPSTALAWAVLFLGMVIFWATIVWLVILL